MASPEICLDARNGYDTQQPTGIHLGIGRSELLDWNVLVTTRQRGFTLACELLEDFGPVRRTHYYNVIVMKAADPRKLLDDLAQTADQLGEMFRSAIARVAPAQFSFNFSSPEEFEAKATEIALAWVSDLAGKTFHVRMHRRGFKGQLSSQDEERFLDHVLTDALQAAGTPGVIGFDDPDAIIAIDSVDNRAAMALWTREDLDRYPFLRLD